MLFRRNNLFIGVGLTLVVSILVFTILNAITDAASLPFKIRTLALIAICANMLIVRGFRKNRANESIRGAVLATVVLSIIWIVWFGAEIYDELQNS